MPKLINQAAVRQLVKDLGRVATRQYLDALDRHLREIIPRQCQSISFGKRLRADAFVGVPPSERK